MSSNFTTRVNHENAEPYTVLFTTDDADKYAHIEDECRVMIGHAKLFEQPTVDAVPVRHGKWIMDEYPHDGDCRCSVCLIAIDAMHERNHELLNALTGGKWWTFYHYCPQCGARMDGADGERR